MTAGEDTYKGLAVPLFGNFEIKGESTSLDIMTITQDGSGTGDFINCQTSGGTATFTVEDDGKVVAAAGMEVACLLAGAKALTVGGDATIACLLTTTKALTATSKLTATGEFLASAAATVTCSLSVGKAVTLDAGDVTVTAGDVVITNGYFLRFTSWPTTAVLSATAVTLGDVWLQMTSTYVQIAIAESTSVIRYVNTTSA